MHWLSSALLAIQVISSLSIIALVLLQQGKGADMGSSFGGGSAGSVFGATGAANFLSRTTKWAAIIFFVSTGGLAWVAHHPAARAPIADGVMQGYESKPASSNGPDVPVVPGATQGSTIPATPGSKPTPAQPDANAVPAAPAASSAPEKTAPSSATGDKTPAGSAAESKPAPTESTTKSAAETAPAKATN